MAELLSHGKKFMRNLIRVHQQYSSAGSKEQDVVMLGAKTRGVTLVFFHKHKPFIMIVSIESTNI